MRHFASPSFWDCYNDLPDEIKESADKNFELLKKDQKHPSLHLKKIKNFWSVRIGKKYRALGIENKEGIIWFWIGKHSDYEKLISSS